ncbi:MAG: hypothetical protein K6348_02340 [Deferribacterales bacterium]
MESKKIKPSCSICAWRGTCNKKFSIKDPSRCIDFTLDLTIDFGDDKQDDSKSEKEDKK